MSLLKRWAQARRDAGWLRQRGHRRMAYLYAAATVCGMRAALPVSSNGRRLWLRPASTDIEVARTNLAGEFAAAIAAAKPLRYGLIVDAGGYIGTAAIALAIAFPAAAVITLEPSRENFAILARNVAPFDNIVPLNCALAAVHGQAALIDRGTGAWGYSLVAEPLDCTTPRYLQNVDTVCIADLLRRFGKDGVDLLKLDVEGAERNILSDSGRWIGATRVILAELHDRIVPGCQAAFEAATAGWTVQAADREKVLAIRGRPPTD